MLAKTDQSVMTHRLRLVESFAMNDRLTRIAVPTLILTGDRDLSACRGGLTELSRGIRRSRSVDLPGCGHLAFATQPDRLALEVKRFLTA